MPEMRLIPRCDFPLQEDQDHDQEAAQTRQGRKRKLPARAVKKGKAETIDPPFPWATTTRATVHNLEHLLAHNMKSINGTVKCKGCQEQYDIEFDLEEKFNEVARFVTRNKCNMHDRAPDAWTNPVLPTCTRCGQENSLRPVTTKKRNTNWLFLLLGQMIGCCKLSHLKYFCKHTMNHSTAAKDRLVYLTYLGLCKQLQPQGPFDP